MLIRLNKTARCAIPRAEAGYFRGLKIQTMRMIVKTVTIESAIT
jgi:hypothetical protein